MPQSLLKRCFQLAVLILLALMVLLPLFWLVSTSLKGPAEDIFSSPPALLPAQPSLKAYWTLFKENPLTTYLINSAVVSVMAVVANLLFCSLAAYPLARLHFAGRGFVLALVVATILIPFQVVMIPLYLLMVQLGLRNTLLAVVIPQAATAFGLYLLRQRILSTSTRWRLPGKSQSRPGEELLRLSRGSPQELRGGQTAHPSCR